MGLVLCNTAAQGEESGHSVTGSGCVAMQSSAALTLMWLVTAYANGIFPDS